MQHDAEAIAAIRIKVNTWLNNNLSEMVELKSEFVDELKNDPDFGYNREQFRCWVWDTLLDKQES